MPNVIALRKTYSTLLDEAYKLASLTAVLDGPNDLAQEGANANEILIPKMSMSGLADYDKQTGYNGYYNFIPVCLFVQTVLCYSFFFFVLLIRSFI